MEYEYTRDSTTDSPIIVSTADSIRDALHDLGEEEFIMQVEIGGEDYE